jgi:hypothetical protein
VFTAVIKQFTTLLCLILWLTAAARAQSTDTPASLNELTKAALQLRYGLMAAEENLFRLTPNTLTIYINTDNLPAELLQEISITLDGKTILQHSFNPNEYQALSSGAMKKVYAAPIEPGQHELIVLVNGSASTEAQNSTTLMLEKGAGHDTLKVTVASLMQKRRPELFFEQQRGEAP